jgi:rhodanese-related sulfurtransferase
MTTILRAIAVAIACFGAPVWASDLADKITGYMDFATYDAGIIVPEQLTQDVFDAALFIDTRDADQFDDATIPGATHIEWREVPGRLDEIPDSGMVILFCNTGSLSAQAVFAARLMGHENVLVLQTGLQGWQQNAAYKPE